MITEFRAVCTYKEGEPFQDKWYTDKRCAARAISEIGDQKHDTKYGNLWTIEMRSINPQAPEQMDLFNTDINRIRKI